MMKLRSLGMAIAVMAALIAGSKADAAQISGSIAFLSGVQSINGTDLSDSTQITFETASLANTILVNSTTGDFNAIPALTQYTVPTLDLTNLTAFTIVDGAFGQFDTVTTAFIVSQSANFLDVYMEGTYSGLAGFDPSPASVRLSFNKTGASVSSAITLAAPPVPPQTVPEPSTMLLAGLGVLGLAYQVRRRRS